MQRVGIVLAAALALLFGGLPAQAAPEASPVQDLASACAAPPCGYIVPAISLDFPDKPICRPQTLGGPIDLTQCIPLPAVGDTHVENGIFRMSWDITQDGTYPADPLQPIVVTFGGTSSNPKWMDLVVEPASLEISAVDLNNPQYLKPEGQSVWFWYEVPLKVTFTREGIGSDDAASTKRIERQQGAVQAFLKAKSSASGQYFKEAFGVEEFRFNPCSNNDALTGAIRQCEGMPGVSSASKESPGVGLAAGASLLALAVALRRRN